MNTASEFLSKTEKAVLFLERALKKDGYECRKSSELVTLKPFAYLTEKKIHIHRLHAKCSESILMSYAQYMMDLYPKTFSETGFSIRACRELPTKLSVTVSPQDSR